MSIVRNLSPNVERFRTIIGAVDPRRDAHGLELITTTTQDSLVAENDWLSIHAVRWPVMDGVSAEGLFLRPKKPPLARFVAIPDADWTPEMISGLESLRYDFCFGSGLPLGARCWSRH